MANDLKTSQQKPRVKSAELITSHPRESSIYIPGTRFRHIIWCTSCMHLRADDMFLRLSFVARLKSASGESASNESRKQIATDVEVQQQTRVRGVSWMVKPVKKIFQTRSAENIFVRIRTKDASNVHNT